jgi:hypothetical protein
MTPELHDKLVEALEIGLDLATSELLNVTAAYAGYTETVLGRLRLTAANQDVQAINEALASLGQQYGELIRV